MALVYTVGRAIVDLYAEETHVSLTDAASFKKYVGGSSANTAVGLARLGADVGLIARIGDDPMGRYVEQKLREERVDTSMLARDPRLATGMAFAALFPPNDSDVWFCPRPNANAALSPHDLKADQIKNARILVIAGTALASESSREAVMQLLALAQQHNLLVVLDVDWRPVFWERPDEAPRVYADVLSRASVVLANEPELALVGGTDSVEDAARHVLGLGASEVVAKRGGAGSWHFSGQEAIHVLPYAVAVVNTLGAGDGFAAGYVYGLLSGWEPRQRMEFASAVGAIVVSRHSCSEAMPHYHEVLQLMEQAERRAP